MQLISKLDRSLYFQQLSMTVDLHSLRVEISQFSPFDSLTHSHYCNIMNLQVKLHSEF